MLEFDDFQKIDFGCGPNGRPLFLNDILTYITGFDCFPQVKRPDVNEEDNRRVPVFPSAGTDEEMQTLKESISESYFKAMERAFKKLWGTGDRCIPDTDIDGVPFLIERNFTQNISEVTGEESKFFGKLLYLFFSGGLDKMKITMQTFIKGLKPYAADDERQKHMQTSFSILDMDRDG